MNRQLLAGCAEVLITPPLGVSMAGYYHDRRADSILDDLYTKALVLSDGQTTAALVVCDLIGLTRSITDRVRRLIAQRLPVPLAQAMICCTHTHTGPILADWPEAGMYADAAYLDVLERKIADAVQLAYQRIQPVSLLAGAGRVEGIAFNRRWWMKDGSLRTNPPLQSPDLDRPAGPIDPELGILLARDARGAALALVNAYALHADEVGGTAFCADYQGVESRLLKRVLGENVAVLCPNGPCGDINHLDFSKPPEGQKGLQVAERSGSALAGEAIRRLAGLQAVPAARLRAGSRTIQGQIRAPSAEDLEWAERAVSGEMSGFDSRGLDVVRAHRMLQIRAQEVSQVPLEVCAFAVGTAAFVGLPGEIFCELGLAIKRGSPFPHTFVAELCNDKAGYVPTRSAYGEGGYEATSSRFAPGTGEQLVEAALDLLAELSSLRAEGEAR